MRTPRISRLPRWCYRESVLRHVRRFNGLWIERAYRNAGSPYGATERGYQQWARENIYFAADDAVRDLKRKLHA